MNLQSNKSFYSSMSNPQTCAVKSLCYTYLWNNSFTYNNTTSAGLSIVEILKKTSILSSSYFNKDMLHLADIQRNRGSRPFLNPSTHTLSISVPNSHKHTHTLTSVHLQRPENINLRSTCRPNHRSALPACDLYLVLHGGQHFSKSPCVQLLLPATRRQSGPLRGTSGVRMETLWRFVRLRSDRGRGCWVLHDTLEKRNLRECSRSARVTPHRGQQGSRRGCMGEPTSQFPRERQPVRL